MLVLALRRVIAGSSQTKILDVRGFDSSRPLVFMCGISRSMWISREFRLKRFSVCGFLLCALTVSFLSEGWTTIAVAVLSGPRGEHNSSYAHLSVLVGALLVNTSVDNSNYERTPYDEALVSTGVGRPAGERLPRRSLRTRSTLRARPSQPRLTTIYDAV